MVFSSPHPHRTERQVLNSSGFKAGPRAGRGGVVVFSSPHPHRTERQVLNSSGFKAGPRAGRGGVVEVFQLIIIFN